MKSIDLTVLSVRNQCSDTDMALRLAALERMISYAQAEAEKLEAHVLAFCLDASLSVVRSDIEGRIAKVEPPAHAKSISEIEATRPH